MRNPGVVGRRLGHRHQSPVVADADDQVGLVVAESTRLCADGRVQRDGHLIGHGAASLATVTRLAPYLLVAQGAVQRAADALVGMGALVDAFVADGCMATDIEIYGDLLRVACPAKSGVNHGRCLGCTARAVFTGPHGARRELMDMLGPVAALSAIATHFLVKARFVAIHHAGNIASVIPGFGKDGNLAAFVSGDMGAFHFGQL